MTVDHFSTASQMIEALSHKDISAVELTEMHIQRIESYDDVLNAIPVRVFDRAREAAIIADQRLAAGRIGPLLGLPMTVKESTQVEGLPQTAGLEAFNDYLPAFDGLCASRTIDAGAVLLGKTNIPAALSDWQADSSVYGRTVNPWDVTRTPGGSTGGGAAALASGLTPLELGSDIGGSIRIPAAYCGVYGHRPSETAIPRSGAFPKADIANASTLLGVQGPLARSAKDLELYFDVLAGAEKGEVRAWRLQIPPPRHSSLREFRVGVLSELLNVTPSESVTSKLEELISFLTTEGCRIDHVKLPFDAGSLMENYAAMFATITSVSTPSEAREAQAKILRQSDKSLDSATADGLTMTAQNFIKAVTVREKFKTAWAELFESYDVIVCPAALDVAFPHVEKPWEERVLLIDGQEVAYGSNVLFAALAVYPGLPATAFPAGFSREGLPVGLQAIGPYLEDRTTMRFAQLLEQQWHGFKAPPDY